MSDPITRSDSGYTAPRDSNRVPLLMAASTSDGITPVVLEADPTTHLLQVSSSGSGGGGTQYTQGGATVTNPTGNSLIYFNGSNQPIAVTSTNPLPITGTISVGSTTDLSAFTAGTSTTGPIGGVFNDGLSTVTSGLQATTRITTNRALHINLRNNGGTEIGTSSTPVQVSLANTAGNATAIKVDGSGVTQPVSLTSTTITGSVAVTGTFFQTTQPISGTVTATQGTAAALTAGWPTINGELGDVTGTFTNATQTTSVTASGLDGYGNTLISINGTYGTATAVFEGSDDGGTTWYAVQAARDNSNVIELGYTSLTNISQTWQINNPGFDSLRVRSTAVTSGTVNVRLSSSAAPVASGTIVGLGTSIPTGANVIGALTANQSVNNAQVSGTAISVNNGTTDAGTSRVTLSSDSTGQVKLAAGSAAIGSLTAGTANLGTVNLSPTASGGWTPYFANAITTTVTPTSAAGKFGGYMLINLNSAPAYLQVFDTTGAVTLGSTAPTFVIPIPANATAANGLAANVELANGIVIANGIKCAATTTSNGATTVSTGITGTLWVK